jgi:hypothetical protein
MNSLLLLNGSPRGERSNSIKMLERIAEGWRRKGGTVEALHLARRDQFARAVTAFAEAETVLLGMPLYTDAMPAVVKEYIEALMPRVAAAKAGLRNPTLGFLVQSGFPEARHSRPVERYLEKLAARLGSRYAGTIVRGGGGALEWMPEQANKKLWQQLRVLGEQLARDGQFGAAELKAIAGRERLGPLTVMLATLACKLPLTQSMWNKMLKENGVWERRFDAPYGPAFRP